MQRDEDLFSMEKIRSLVLGEPDVNLIRILVHRKTIQLSMYSCGMHVRIDVLFISLGL